MLSPILATPSTRPAGARRPAPKTFQPVDRFTPGTPPTPELLFRQAAQSRPTEELTSTFPGREGYDENFLNRPFPLPQLDPSIRHLAAPLLREPGETELEYTNFSIVMNKERRLPFFTAVNIDGEQLVSVPRDGNWTIDGRIARHHQLGNEAYTRNPIDRGHMVRRRDPVWGPKARQASRDTFVYTNAGLQHRELNQKEWLELENHILDHARTQDARLTVLTGPVFKPDDPAFDNKGRVNPPTQIPEEFWKLVVWNDPEEGLKGAAFVLSQEDLVNGSGLFQSALPPGRFQVYQVPIQQLEEMTKLDFGEVTNVCSNSRRIERTSQVLL